MNEEIAKFCGYIEAMNYTGRMAYFKRDRNGEYIFIAHVKEYEPRIKSDQFVYLLDTIISKKMKISIAKVSQKTSKFINVITTLEAGPEVIKSESIDVMRSVTNAIARYLNKDLNNTDNE